MMSLWPGPVGSPVDGPPRITLTMTHGTSVRQAKPMFSCLSENPGPRVAVIDFAPASERADHRGHRGDLVLHLDEPPPIGGSFRASMLGDLGTRG